MLSLLRTLLYFLLLSGSAGCGRKECRSWLSTPPFYVKIEVEDNARKRLEDLNEKIELIVCFEGTSHRFPRAFPTTFTAVIGPAGGTIAVMPVDLSREARCGEKLVNITINVVSARKAEPVNILSCQSLVVPDRVKHDVEESALRFRSSVSRKTFIVRCRLPKRKDKMGEEKMGENAGRRNRNTGACVTASPRARFHFHSMQVYRSSSSGLQYVHCS